jgi:xylulokinase
MANEAVLGIDIGTSGCKALLLSTAGTLIGSETATYDLSQPRPGWTEQDPALWIEGARRAVGTLRAAHPDVEIRAIGLSGQMHGLTPLDEADRVLRPALLWNDQRNGAECAAMTEKAGGEAALRTFTNNRMLLGYTGGKVAWMKNHEPELFARLKHVLNPKDYLRLVLTGEKATEVSDASGTGLFDVRARAWSFALMEKLGIDAALFPACHESPDITGRVSRSGAERLGLPEGIPVVGGGGDSVIQTIGSGVIAPGDVQTTIGTAGIVASALDRVIDNPGSRLQVFCNVAPGKWHAMGVTLNAGFAMSWFQRLLRSFAEGRDWSYEEIVACAGASQPGSRGLVFLPYLNGERAPHSDPDARGAFIGLTGLHGPSDMARSVMEGIAFALYDIFTVMRDAGIEASVVKASGGGARSVLWRQMQADLFGCDVVTTEGAAEGAAFGAALVAGLGIGLFATPEQAAGLCRPLTHEAADAGRRAQLQSGFTVYQALYPALRDNLHALAHAFDDTRT